MSTLSAAPDRAQAARLFHALSDETRLAVLEMLRGVLKESGLVQDPKEGRWSYYSLVPETLGEAHDVVRTLATEKAAPGGLKVFGSCGG